LGGASGSATLPDPAGQPGPHRPDQDQVPEGRDEDRRDQRHAGALRREQVEEEPVEQRDRDERRPHPRATQPRAHTSRPKALLAVVHRLQGSLEDMPELWVSHLGLVPYDEALELQHELRERRSAGTLPDLLLVLEHPPVYTKGKRTAPGDLPMGEDWYRAQGIEVRDTDRGGRVTYHGPGQLVAYPIMEVDRVADFVHTMERAIVAALADEGVAAEPRDTPFTGVWAGEAKIGSIGVRVRDGVSTHGLAVNVDNDLQPFEWIVPCGIDHVRVTSVSRETGRAGSLPCFRKRLAHRFCEAFGRRQRLVSRERLRVREEVAA
jgi:lipoate-protein ligase B